MLHHSVELTVKFIMLLELMTRGYQSIQWHRIGLDGKHLCMKHDSPVCTPVIDIIHFSPTRYQPHLCETGPVRLTFT